MNLPRLLREAPEGYRVAMSASDETERKRQYRMKARAAAAEETREKILDACEAAFDELQADKITLGWIAKRAGVSVQTVIRRFGGKESLFLQTILRAGGEMVGDRDVEPGSSPEEVIDVLIDHYERFGHRILRMLAQEERIPQLKILVDVGRTYHVNWCNDAFAPALRGLEGRRRERRLAQLSTVTDILAWKVLRQDRGLGVEETKLAMVELIEPLAERRT